MASWCSFWEVATGESTRCTGAVKAGSYTGTTNDSSILGGPLSGSGSHSISASCSTIVMGNTNIIGTVAGGPEGYNSILNGSHNTVSGLYNSVLGGSQHFINDACFNLIGHGFHNVIGPGACNVSILGGVCNSVSAYAGVILGGNRNNITAAGGGSIIGNNAGSTIRSASSGIFSGLFNLIDGNSDCSFLGGGCLNTINPDAPYSVISGGQAHCLHAPCSTISGGCHNVI